MPANLPKEWYLVEEEFRNAKTLEEKIELLKKLISVTPKHKGTENLLAQLRKRLARLEERKESVSKKRATSKTLIEKSGDILVSIIGLTKSGKSTLLKSLTNANVEISEIPYTTKEPVTGVCFYKGVYIQFVEIPSLFLKEHLAIAHNSDIILLLTKNENELKELGKILEENNLMNKKKIVVNVAHFFPQRNLEAKKDFSELLDGIIKEAGIIRVFTKPPGKKVEERAVVLKKGDKLIDLVEKVNKRWLSTFKFARIFDNSPTSGRKVGLEYELKDGDIVEIHF